MLILWIRRKKGDKQGLLEKKEPESFHKHDDIMKKFRLSHADINVSDAKEFMMEESADLMPVHEVKLPANIQN